MNVKNVLTHLKTVNDFIKLPEDAVKLVEKTVNIIASDGDFESKVDNIYVKLFDNNKWDWKDVEALAAEKNVDAFELALTLVELFTMGTKLLYEKKGWPEDVYFDNLLDITIWAKVYFNNTGKWGLAEYSWLCMSLSGDVIRLGRLQFQFIRTQESVLPVTVGGITVKHDDLVINIHIPEGDGITKEKRYDSYRKAYNFFRQTGHAVFMCHSWLLYPKHCEFLPATSNVVDFIHDFNIVSSSNGNGELWRLFGPAWKASNGNPELLPQDTGMRRAYVKHLREGGTCGSGLGFFVFDGQNIIS